MEDINENRKKVYQQLNDLGQYMQNNLLDYQNRNLVDNQVSVA